MSYCPVIGKISRRSRMHGLTIFEAPSVKTKFKNTVVICLKTTNSIKAIVNKTCEIGCENQG